MKIRILFNLRWKKTKVGPFYIYCRLTINGERAKCEMSTGIAIDHLSEWDSRSKKIRGHGEVVEEKNKALDAFYADLMYLYNLEISKGKVPIPEAIRNQYVKKENIVPVVLIDFYEWFVGKHTDVAKATIKQWKSRCLIFRGYLTERKKLGVCVADVNARFAMDFYEWTTARGCGRNHAVKSVSSLSKVLSEAVLEGVILANPLRGLRLVRDKQKEIVYLTEGELLQIAACNYFDNRLQKVADCFLLQCYTGMAYNELLSFKAEKHLIADTRGVLWIMIYRGKTEELCRIPLLPQAKNILEKYKLVPPVITNQKMNEFLKELGRVANIKNPERLTTHVGRRTAGTYLLNKGVPMLTVSKILGHKSIKTTEAHYAFLQTDTIYEHIKGLL